MATVTVMVTAWKKVMGLDMFSRSRTLEERGYFRGFTDWHSHLLYGVDDGVRTLEESLAILGEWERLGVKGVWLSMPCADLVACFVAAAMLIPEYRKFQKLNA